MGCLRDERWQRGASLRLILLAATSLVVGCVRTTGTLPRVAVDNPRDGFKLLRPHARAERCEGALFGTFSTSEGDVLEDVFRDLLALDEEATMVRGARVEWTAWSIGVYGRRCIAMEGDVVRPAATVLLPMAGEHLGH